MTRIGRYRIVKELGRGAMGVVYLALDPHIGRDVAIKTIRLGEVQKPEERERLRERLFREARSAGMLSHPGIVTIYDVDEQGDLAYIAMEYVNGPTLDYLLSQEQAISREQMLSVLGQTSAALDYAHSKGIVHRDIKPANIMIAADGSTKVTDFGIAKVSTNEHLTITGTIVGTPHYMSPEQVQGQEVDGRSDQFSLAVIVYEMLTGEKPYTGEHLTTVVYKIVAEEPPAPHRLNMTLAGGIEDVLRRAMSKKPEGRFATCQEFTAALEAACAANPGWKTMARGGSLSGPTVVEKAAAVSLPPPRRERFSESTAEAQPGRKPGFWAFLMAILVATGLLALLGWQAGPWLAKSPAPPATQPSGETKAAPQQSPQTASAPQTTPTIPEPPAPPPADTGKPSPLPPPLETQAAPPANQPAETKPAEASPTTEPAPPAVQPAAVAPRVTYPVTVVSSPGGGTVTLDGRPQTACTAPCSVNAAPGHHTIVISMAGYQPERREVEIGTGGIELPPVILRASGATLMVTSEPTGASISVNGKKLPQLTPAQVMLSPGTYTIQLEKDGKQVTRSVDVRNDTLNYLKVGIN
jgi:serine/threonine protein kinase